MWFSLLESYGMGHNLHCCHVIQPAWKLWNGSQSALLPFDSARLSHMEWGTVCIVAMWFSLLEPYGVGHSLHCCLVVQPAWAVWNGSQSALLPCDSACLSPMEWVTVCIVAMWFSLLEPYGMGHNLHCFRAIQPAWTVWNGLVCVVAFWFSLLESYGMGHSLHCCHVIQPAWVVWNWSQSALLPCDSACLSHTELVTVCGVAMWFSLLESYGIGHSLQCCHLIQPAWVLWVGHSLHCCHVIQPAWAVWNGSQSALLPCDSACLNRMEWVTVCVVAFWFSMLESYGMDHSLHCCHVIQPAWVVWNWSQSALLPCDSACLSRMELVTVCSVAMWFSLLESFGMGHSLQCCHLIQPAWFVWNWLQSALLPCDSACLSHMEWATVCIVAMWFSLPCLSRMELVTVCIVAM